MMMCVAISLVAKPGCEESMLKLLQTFIPKTKGVAGAVRFEAHRSRSDPRAFLLYQLYARYEDLLAHRADLLFAEWRPQIAELEESRDKQEFDTIAIS